MSRFVLIIAILGCLSSCTSVQYRPVELPLAIRPVLPSVSRAELQCLAPDTYLKVVDRERGYKNWGLENEATLKTNNEKARGGKH